MKRMIKSASTADIRQDERFEFTVPRTRHRYVFRGTIDYTHGWVTGQLTRIAPYDDADYYWAKIGDGGTNFVKFIQDGKIRDRMQYWYYDQDDYEDVNEYLSDIMLDMCEQLDHYNDDIKPRIIHN